MRMKLMHCIEKVNQINSQLMYSIERHDQIILKLWNGKIANKKLMIY